MRTLLEGALALAVIALFAVTVMGAAMYFDSHYPTPAPAESCAYTQRMVRIQLSPAAEAAIDNARGDRWLLLEAREVPREGGK